MVSIVTANIGGHDPPKTHAEQSVDCEFTMVDDNFLFVMVEDARDHHPRFRAKEPKLRPWCFSDDGPWIWLDASFEIISPTFVEEVLDATGDNSIGQWAHPDRDCVYPEADLSATLAKYESTPVLEQAAHYRKIGHPEHWGLWATGLIVYKQPVDYLADLWWAEMNRWGYQDQVSQPVALRNAGLRPTSLPYDLRVNPWLALHSHRSHL